MKRKWSNKEWLCLIALTCICSIPLFYPALFQANPAHDLAFHIQRLAAIAKNLKEGLPMQLQLFWVHDQGYAVGAFYPSIFLIPFAFLHNLGLHLDVCWKIMIACINLATTCIAYGSFTRIFKDKKYGMFATVLYVCAPYRLTDLYLRAALGESLAMMFLPLVADGLHGVYQKEDQTAVYRMGIAYAGVCASHELSLFFVVLFTIVYCLLRFQKTFTKDVLKRLLQATALAVCLSLYFLVPMKDFSNNALKMNHEYREVYKESAYLWQLFGLFSPVFGGSGHIGWYGHEMPFYIGWPMVIGMGLFPWLYSLKKDREEYCVYALLLLSIILCTNIFPYQYLETKKWADFFIVKIQFPWRFSMMIALFGTITATLAVMKLHTEKKKQIGLSLMIFALGLGVIHQESFIKHADYGAIQTEEDLDSGNYMGGEFLPSPHDNKVLKTSEPIIDGNNCTIITAKKDNFDVVLDVKNDTKLYQKIYLPFVYYKQYKAYDVNTHQNFVLMNDDTGKMAVVVPDHYHGILRVTYIDKTSYKASRILSLLLLCYIVYKMQMIAKNMKKC